MFEDDSGNMSSMRVLAFVFTLFCICVSIYVLLIWGYISIKTMTFQPLNFSDIVGIGGAVGGLCFKALQKKYETSKPDDKEG